MAHQIETRKLDNRHIILHYFFEPIQVPISCSDDSTLTADKWLDICDWVWLNRRINSMVELYQRQEGSISNTTNEELNDTSLQCCFSWKKVSSSTCGRSFKDVLRLRSSETVNHYISVRVSQSKISKISKQIKALNQEFAAAKEFKNLDRSGDKEPAENTSDNALVISDFSEAISYDEVIPETPEKSQKYSGTIYKVKKASTNLFPHNSAEQIVETDTVIPSVVPKKVSSSEVDNNSAVHEEKKIRPEKLYKGIPVEPPNRLYRERKNMHLKESREDAEYIPFSVLPAKHEEYRPGNSEHQFSQEEYTPTHSTPPDKINPVYKPSSSVSNSKLQDKYIPSEVPSESQISPAPVYTPSRRKRHANTDEYDPTTPGPATQRTKRNKSSKIIPTTDMTANCCLPTPERATDKQSPSNSNKTDTLDPKVTTNLFGESDEETRAAGNTNTQQKLLRRAKTCQNLKVGNSKKELPVVKDSGWLSKPSVDREKRTDSHPKTASTKSMDQLSGSRSTRSKTDTHKTIKIEDVKGKDIVNEQTIAALKDFNKKMQSETLPDIKLLDLKKITNEELNLHFNESCKEFLFPHFEKYCKQKEYRPIRNLDLPMYIMNYLLTNEQQLKMMTILQEYFSSEKTNYEELFWEVMMPEWSLALFMSSFKMDRKEAIKRIELQIKILEANSALDDLYNI